MKVKFFDLLFCAGILYIGIVSYKNDITINHITTGTTAVPEVYKKIYNAADMYVQGNYLVVKVTCLPDHKSPYYQGTQWQAAKYEQYNGSNSRWRQNPNSISEKDI